MLRGRFATIYFGADVTLNNVSRRHCHRQPAVHKFAGNFAHPSAVTVRCKNLVSE